MMMRRRRRRRRRRDYIPRPRENYCMKTAVEVGWKQRGQMSRLDSTNEDGVRNIKHE